MDMDDWRGQMMADVKAIGEVMLACRKKWGSLQFYLMTRVDPDRVALDKKTPTQLAEAYRADMRCPVCGETITQTTPTNEVVFMVPPGHHGLLPGFAFGCVHEEGCYSQIPELVDKWTRALGLMDADAPGSVQ